MRLRFVLAALTVVAACAPAGPVSRYLSDSEQLVLFDPADPATFEVVGQPGAGPAQYWCAAGDYVMRGLHLDPATQVILITPPGPSMLSPGRTAARFAAAPGAQAATLNLSEIGQGWHAGHVGTNCAPLHPVAALGED